MRCRLQIADAGGFQFSNFLLHGLQLGELFLHLFPKLFGFSFLAGASSAVSTGTGGPVISVGCVAKQTCFADSCDVAPLATVLTL